MYPNSLKCLKQSDYYIRVLYFLHSVPHIKTETLYSLKMPTVLDINKYINI